MHMGGKSEQLCHTMDEEAMDTRTSSPVMPTEGLWLCPLRKQRGEVCFWR